MHATNRLSHAPAQGALELQDEEQLWQQLRNQGDVQARERLLAHYLPYAKTVAASYYARRMHDEIEFDDYYQFATLGMVEALGRFDPQVGVQFRTFAARRMHGAILNGLETMTEKQQQIAVRRRLQRERVASISDSARGAARNDMSRSRGAAQTEALFGYLAEVGVGIALAFMLDGTGMYDGGEGDVKGQGSDVYYRRTELRQLRRKLLSHVDGLKPQARHVILCHYVQEMAFDDIAKSMGLTKGRISQIHREALLALRGELHGEDLLDIAC